MEEDKKRKIIRIATIAGAAIFALAVIVALILYIINPDLFRPKDKPDDGTYAELETEETIAVYGQDVLDRYVGRKTSTPIYRCLQQHFLTENEKKSAPHKNVSPENEDNYYGATIDEKTVKGLIVTPEEWTYKINVRVSDGRLYDMYYRINTDLEYVYAVVYNRNNSSYHYCASDSDNIPLDEVKAWLQNSLRIAPEAIANFPEK